MNPGPNDSSFFTYSDNTERRCKHALFTGTWANRSSSRGRRRGSGSGSSGTATLFKYADIRID